MLRMKLRPSICSAFHQALIFSAHPHGSLSHASTHPCQIPYSEVYRRCTGRMYVLIYSSAAVLFGVWWEQGTVTDLDDVRKAFEGGDITGVVVALGGKTKDVGKTMLTDGEIWQHQPREIEEAGGRERKNITETVGSMQISLPRGKLSQASPRSTRMPSRRSA